MLSSWNNLYKVLLHQWMYMPPATFSNLNNWWSIQLSKIPGMIYLTRTKKFFITFTNFDVTHYFAYKAMLSWFLGWQSDRCALFRANGIIKLHLERKKLHFIFYSQSTDCTEKVCEKSTMQEINRAWPNLGMWQHCFCSVYITSI